MLIFRHARYAMQRADADCRRFHYYYAEIALIFDVAAAR